MYAIARSSPREAIVNIKDEIKRLEQQVETPKPASPGLKSKLKEIRQLKESGARSGVLNSGKSNDRPKAEKKEKKKKKTCTVVFVDSNPTKSEFKRTTQAATKLGVYFLSLSKRSVRSLWSVLNPDGKDKIEGGKNMEDILNAIVQCEKFGSPEKFAFVRALSLGSDYHLIRDYLGTVFDSELTFDNFREIGSKLLDFQNDVPMPVSPRDSPSTKSSSSSGSSSSSSKSSDVNEKKKINAEVKLREAILAPVKKELTQVKGMAPSTVVDDLFNELQSIYKTIYYQRFKEIKSKYELQALTDDSLKHKFGVNNAVHRINILKTIEQQKSSKELPQGKKTIGSVTLEVYTEEQQKRLGINQWGVAEKIYE